MTQFAIFDPNWGEPKPILETVRNTPEAAIEAALSLDSLQLWARERGWEQLVDTGFFVNPVSVTQAYPVPAEVEKLIDLARIYFEDGAPLTAAARLRQAADHLEAIR